MNNSKAKPDLRKLSARNTKQTILDAYNQLLETTRQEPTAQVKAIAVKVIESRQTQESERSENQQQN